MSAQKARPEKGQTMTAATYRLPMSVEFLVIPSPQDLEPAARDLLRGILNRTPKHVTTPAGETLVSRSVFDLVAWNENWDPESLEGELGARRETRSVVVPVQF